MSTFGSLLGGDGLLPYDVWVKTGGSTKEPERRWKKLGQIRLPYPYWNALSLVKGQSPELQRDFVRYGTLRHTAQDLKDDSDRYSPWTLVRSALVKLLNPKAICGARHPHYEGRGYATTCELFAHHTDAHYGGGAQWQQRAGEEVRPIELPDGDFVNINFLAMTVGTQFDIEQGENTFTLTTGRAELRRTGRRTKRTKLHIVPPMNVLLDLRTTATAADDGALPRGADDEGAPFVMSLPGMVEKTDHVVQGWPWDPKFTVSVDVLRQANKAEALVAIDAGLDKGLAGLTRGPGGLTRDADGRRRPLFSFDKATLSFQTTDPTYPRRTRTRKLKNVTFTQSNGLLSIGAFGFVGHVGIDDESDANEWVEIYGGTCDLVQLRQLAKTGVLERPDWFDKGSVHFGERVFITLAPGDATQLLVYLDELEEQGRLVELKGLGGLSNFFNAHRKYYLTGEVWKGKQRLQAERRLTLERFDESHDSSFFLYFRDGGLIGRVHEFTVARPNKWVIIKKGKYEVRVLRADLLAALGALA